MKKITAILLTALTAGCVVGGVGYVTNGYVNWNIDSLRTKFNTSQTVDVEYETESDSEVSNDSAAVEVLGNNMSLYVRQSSVDTVDDYGISAQAASISYIITAYVSPDTAHYDESDFVFTAQMGNGDPNGEFINLVQNGMKCVVTLIKPFSTSITITGRFYNDPSINAVCTVDYVKRVNDLSFINQNSTDNNKVKLDGSTAWFRIPSVTYTDGTLTGDVTYSNLTLTLDSGLRSYIQNNVAGYGSHYSFKSYSMANFAGNSTPNLSIGSFLQYMGDSSSYAGKINNAFINYCNSNTATLTATFTYSITYGGTVFETNTYTKTFGIDISGLSLATESVSLDKTSIVF